MLDFAERDRRYNLIRGKMKAQNIDALIVISSSQITEKGFVKYLSNYRHILYNLVVIFPLSGPSVLLAPSPLQRYWADIISWIDNVEEQIPSLSESIIKNIKKIGLENGTIGLINTKIMPAEVFVAIKEKMLKATLVDATYIIEEVRMMKSEAEINLVKKAAKLADKSFEVLAKSVKPGLTEREIIGAIDDVLISNGSEDIFHLFTSKPGAIFPYAASERKIEKGDVVILNTELSGPGGYWVQMVRTSFVGKPKLEIENMYNILIDISKEIKNKLIPGKKAVDIAKWARDQIINAGYETGVNFGHCLGLDVVERPLVRLNEETELQPGMIITVHPQLVNKKKDATVWIGDTYLVTERAAKVLTKVDPNTIKEIG